MKILMTGMSARSVGSTKIRYDFVALSDIFHAALEELGHQVDRRVVLVDEADTLDQYDKGLVLVNWASSLSSMHVHEAALALSRLGQRAILYVDDWRTESLGDDLDHHVKRDHGWEHHVTKFRRDYYALLTPRQREVARRELLSMIDPSILPYRRHMVAPFHPWGYPRRHMAVSKVPLNVSMSPIDPSSMVEVPDVGCFSARNRKWVLATLQNQDRWSSRLGNKWPIVQLGGVKKEGGGLRANTKAVLPERTVVQSYAMNRGMLVAPYRNEGSGWWRPRYTFALGVGAVCHVGSAIDAALIGPSFTNSIEDVEEATDSELDALAARQREQFEDHQQGKEEFMDRLDWYVTNL